MKKHDPVEWNFLEYMIRRLGFVNKWINWISTCLKSATVSVLVNGSPTKEFKPKRGLRQGDPLAPFLFLIVAEGLVRLVREVTRIGVLEGINVGEKEVDVTLLRFADDTLFVCQPNYQSILVIKAILRNYEVVSGLRVNFYKSKVGGVGILEMDMTIFCKCLNCGRMSFPLYLGVSIGGNPRKVKFWRPIIHKIESRLFMWKGKLLSMVGRLCLIKSVITALPLFYMSFFTASKLVCMTLRKYNLNSFGGGTLKGRKSIRLLGIGCADHKMRGVGS